MSALTLLLAGLVACDEKHGPTDSPYRGQVVLNEASCHDQDWVEIVRVAGDATDLGGWMLTDDPALPEHAFVIPSGAYILSDATALDPGGFLLTIGRATDDASGFAFDIVCGASTIYLLDPEGREVDRVAVGDVPRASSWGRLPDVMGSWQENGPSRWRRNHPPAAALFDPRSVSTVEITLPVESWSGLLEDPFGYQRGELQVTTASGTYAPLGPVGIRLRRGEFFRPLDGKPSFRISIDQWTDSWNRIFGLTRLNLANLVDDPTMMHETLAYATFREAGVPASRTGYARVSVNGEDFGLYATLEVVDWVMAESRFESTHHIYEGMGDLDATAFDDGLIEMDEGGGLVETEDLTALIGAVHAQPDGAWEATVASRIELDRFVRLWAVENWVGHSAGYAESASSYFLHSDDTGFFTMLPWTLDRAFVQAPEFPTCQSILCSRCTAVLGCRSRYDAALDAVAQTIAAMDLDTWITEIDGVIGSHVQQDPRREFTYADYQQAVTDLRAFLAGRPAALP